MTVPILTDTAAVRLFAEQLAREQAIAVDLEADSLHSYRDKVCLLQISTPERTLLIDPLAVRDLSALRPVLADPAIRKIFHAADYDLRCLHRDFGLEVRGLFDTMVASQFLGEEKIGLADVLLKYFSVTLDKQYQRADWSMRPLPAEMLAYAAADTCHLHRLAGLLEPRLRARGRIEWVEEEFRLLEGVRHSESSGPLFLRVKGAAALDRRQLALLEALLQWRDREACRRDRPPFKIVGNTTLLDLARTAPRTLPGLIGIPGLTPRLAERYGRELLRIVGETLALPPGELPVYPRAERRERDPEAEQRLARLKVWRLEAAARLKLDPGILINNALLEELARRQPASAAELEEVPLKNWQRRLLGPGILGILSGPHADAGEGETSPLSAPRKSGRE